MKQINELTDLEAKQILKFVFPDKNHQFTKIEFEPRPNKDGTTNVTFGLRPIVGILYHNGQDNCILHFDHSKVVLWLYKNGFDILELLELNENLTFVEQNLENLAFRLYSLLKTPEFLKYRGKKDTEIEKIFTLEYVLKEIKEAADKYYYNTDY